MPHYNNKQLGHWTLICAYMQAVHWYRKYSPTLRFCDTLEFSHGVSPGRAGCPKETAVPWLWLRAQSATAIQSNRREWSENLYLLPILKYLPLKNSSPAVVTQNRINKINPSPLLSGSTGCCNQIHVKFLCLSEGHRLEVEKIPNFVLFYFLGFFVREQTEKEFCFGVFLLLFISVE